MQKYKQKETHKFTGSYRGAGQRKVREQESETGRKKLEEDAERRKMAGGEKTQYTGTNVRLEINVGRRNTNVLLHSTYYNIVAPR